MTLQVVMATFSKPSPAASSADVRFISRASSSADLRLASSSSRAWPCEFAGAGAGTIADVQVEAFAYTGGAGERILVYLSRDGWEFPVATGARFAAGATGPWTASADGLHLLCSTKPHEVLIVGANPSLVRHVAETMGAI